MPARLLTDEIIPARAIDALRNAGCDVLSIREHAPESDDDEVLRIAVAPGDSAAAFTQESP